MDYLNKPQSKGTSQHPQKSLATLNENRQQTRNIKNTSSCKRRRSSLEDNYSPMEFPPKKAKSSPIEGIFSGFEKAKDYLSQLLRNAILNFSHRITDTSPSMSNNSGNSLDSLQTPPKRRQAKASIEHDSNGMKEDGRNIYHRPPLNSSPKMVQSKPMKKQQSTRIGREVFKQSHEEAFEECFICKDNSDNTNAPLRPNSVLALNPALSFMDDRSPKTIDNVIRIKEKKKYAELIQLHTSTPISNDAQKFTSTRRLTEKLTTGYEGNHELSPLHSDATNESISIHLSNKQINDHKITNDHSSGPMDDSFKSADDAVLGVSLKSRKPGNLDRSSRKISGSTYDLEWLNKWKEKTKEEIKIRKEIERESGNLKNIDVMKEKSIDKLIQEIDIIKDEKKIEPANLFPTLDNCMKEAINSALHGGPNNKVLSEEFNITITRSDIKTLSNCNWLNDEVINFYFNLISRRSQNEKSLPKVHVFNTFFYPKLSSQGYSSVRRWTKKVDIFQFDLLLIPIHLGVHWCLATIDFRKKEVKYYDSMLGSNYKCVDMLLEYIGKESKDKRQKEYDVSEWNSIMVKDVPQQMNGSDCGVFACKFADCVSRDLPLAFEQENMPYFRHLLIYEIVHKRLL